MKLAWKLSILVLLTALVFVPLRAAQAKEPVEGPIFGSNYTLKSGDTLNEDLVVLGGSITIEKDALVKGTILLIGGSLSMDGEATHDVVVIGGAVQLGSEAHIVGNLVTVGAPVARAEGARVDGDVINEPAKPSVTVPVTPVVPSSPNVVVNTAVNMFWGAVDLFARSLGIGLLAALIVLFLPTQTRRVGEAIPTQPITTGAMGLLSVLLFITAMVALGLFSVLIVTLILTVPMILVVSVAFAAAAVFGWIGLGTEIGLRFNTAIGQDLPLPLTAGLGTFALNLVANGIGFIPCVGWLVPTVLGMLALGAVFMTRFGTRPLLVTATPVPVEPVPSAENV